MQQHNLGLLYNKKMQREEKEGEVVGFQIVPTSDVSFVLLVLLLRSPSGLVHERHRLKP